MADARVSRVVGEVVSPEPLQAGVTRVDLQVGGEARGASTAALQVSRVVGEVVSRQGITGSVTPLPLATDSEIFLHNWVSGGSLTTSYMTSVERSPGTGAESRRGLVQRPTRSMRLFWMTNDRARLDRLEVFLRRITDARFQVPLYPDQLELATTHAGATDTLLLNPTQGRFFVGARVVVVRLTYDNQMSSFSFHTIAQKLSDRLILTGTLGTDASAGSLVLPVLDCEIAVRPVLKMLAAQTVQLVMEVNEVAGPSALPALVTDTPEEFDEFAGLPIWYVEPDWAADVDKGRDRDSSSTSQGRTTFVSKKGTRSRRTHDLTITGDRTDQWPVVRFFDSRRGRLRTFWNVDQDQIWQVVEIDASGAFIGVSEFGDFADFQDEFDFVGLVMSDGTVYVREVVTIQQVLTVFRITVTPALPAGLSAADVVRIARARITRMDSDSFEESWSHTGYMETKLTMLEALDEADQEIGGI